MIQNKQEISHNTEGRNINTLNQSEHQMDTNFGINSQYNEERSLRDPNGNIENWNNEKDDKLNISSNDTNNKILYLEQITINNEIETQLTDNMPENELLCSKLENKPKGDSLKKRKSMNLELYFKTLIVFEYKHWTNGKQRLREQKYCKQILLGYVRRVLTGIQIG
jgi:hypothetical protein